MEQSELSLGVLKQAQYASETLLSDFNSRITELDRFYQSRSEVLKARLEEMLNSQALELKIKEVTQVEDLQAQIQATESGIGELSGSVEQMSSRLDDRLQAIQARNESLQDGIIEATQTHLIEEVQK